MESPKKRFSSFKEDSPGSPSSIIFRPRSPFRSGRSSPRRPSNSPTTAAQSNTDVLSEPISCVTRETFQEDCARHRFIVWAAVKRNACTRMKAEEKLRCPLLRCNQHFPDHELMLRHLAGCEHLVSGEYWCYDHMRIERFDDVKCKHCLGHPSKRRKMLAVAKTFFHSLGHRSKKGQQGFEFDLGDSSMPPPPSYDSISVTQLADLNELSANERPVELEAISTEISVLSSSLTSTVAAIDPQALLVPRVPELESTNTSLPTFMEWHPSQILDEHHMPMPSLDDTGLDSPTSSGRPSLQLNTFGLQGPWQTTPPLPKPKPPVTTTRSKNLSPSSSLRSTISTNSNTSSLISPISNWSGGFSMHSGINTGLTSPVDDLDAHFTQSWNTCDSLPADFDFLNGYSELPADVPDTKGAGDISCHPLLMPSGEDFSISHPYPSDIVFTEDSNDDLSLADLGLNDLNTCCSDTTAVVTSASDALQAHLDESILKIQYVTGNSLADQLRRMPAEAIAGVGLRALRELLRGNNPSSAIDALCFTHLIYSFCMTTHQQDAVECSTNLFLQALTYATGFSATERDMYIQLVSLIWQPPKADLELKGAHSRWVMARGKQPETATGRDILLAVACSFLDEIEISLRLGPAPVSPLELESTLYGQHCLDEMGSKIMHTPFPMAVRSIIQDLLHSYADAGGIEENLRKVRERLGSRGILSVRRAEIELIKAGKGCMDTLRYYDQYVPDVRRHCDLMYDHDDSGNKNRTMYQALAVLLLENMMAPGNLEDKADDPLEFITGLTPDYQPAQTTSFPSFDQASALSMGGMDLDLSGSDMENHTLQIPKVTTTPPDSLNSHGLPTTTSEYLHNQEQTIQPEQQQEQPADESQGALPVEAETGCDECGYKPKGDPKWFKSSLAKHRKKQHSELPPTWHKCNFPGCTSQFKNREDNLKQHKTEKGHWLDAEEDARRRPSKRKKVAQDDD